MTASKLATILHRRMVIGGFVLFAAAMAGFAIGLHLWLNSIADMKGIGYAICVVAWVLAGTGMGISAATLFVRRYRALSMLSLGLNTALFCVISAVVYYRS